MEGGEGEHVGGVQAKLKEESMYICYNYTCTGYTEYQRL